MDKRFEKLLIFAMIIAGIALPLLSGTSEASAVDGDGLIGSTGLINQHPGIMRFHVVANSDSEEDQELKISVRNYVLTNIQNEITGQIVSAGEDADQSAVMRSFIQNNLPKIEEWAKEAIKAQGYDYGVNATIGIRHIPAKYYGELFFPEGNYEALTLSIGEGKGQNWWCVVFPPLCFVDSEYSAYTEELGVTESDKLVLKFKTAQLLEDNTSASDILRQALCMYVKDSLNALPKQ